MLYLPPKNYFYLIRFDAQNGHNMRINPTNHKIQIKMCQYLSLFISSHLFIFKLLEFEENNFNLNVSSVMYVIYNISGIIRGFPVEGEGFNEIYLID